MCKKFGDILEGLGNWSFERDIRACLFSRPDAASRGLKRGYNESLLN